MPAAAPERARFRMAMRMRDDLLVARSERYSDDGSASEGTLVPTYDETLSLEKVVQDVFPGADPKGVHAALDAPTPGGERLSERVKLACVLLSAGSLKRLHHYVREAGMDSRDVLYWAFYYDDAPPTHMRAYLKR